MTTGTGGCGSLTADVADRPARDVLDRWDGLVRHTPGGDVAQLSGWAELRRSVGYRAVHLLVWRGPDLVGGAQILVKRVPLLGDVGYVSNGPLVAGASEGHEVVRHLVVERLAEVGRGMAMLFVQPPDGESELGSVLARHGFRPSPTQVAPAASVALDLSRPEADLRGGLSKTLRTWTNRWTDRGVLVRPGSADDIPRVTSLLAHTARHQGFDPFSADYLRTMYEQLGASGDVAIRIGEVEGLPLAVDVLTVCAGRVKMRFIGTDRSEPAGRLSVSAAVHWDGIRWSQRHGHRWFDFGGLRAETARALERGADAVDVESLPGPDRAKLRFGGSAYTYPRPVEMISSRLLRRTYDLAQRSEAGRAVLHRAASRARGVGRSPAVRDAVGR